MAFEYRYDLLNDVISDVTLDWIPLEFIIFRAFEQNNLTSSHPMLTKLDMINNQLVKTNPLERPHE